MKATIVNNVENTSRVMEIPENISSVGSLKNYISASDGRIFEGVTHTDLDNDSAPLPQLPEDKKERGYVFFVSPAQNKTRNGLYTRAECYQIIKEKGLAEEVKSRFSRNFTQVPTVALNSVIEEHEATSTPSHSTHTPSQPSVSAPASNPTVASAIASAVVTSMPSAPSASNEVATEKDLWRAFINEVCPVEKVAQFNEMVEKVFPNPYSVQDLANMRK